MESVHKSDTRPWISKRYNIRKFQNDWSEKILSRKRKKPTKELFSKTEFAKIAEMCSLESMMVPHQKEVELTDSLVIPDNVDLKTLRLQKQDLIRRQEDTEYATKLYNMSKNNNYPIESHVTPLNVETIPFEQVKEPNVILRVQIYRPEKRNTANFRIGASRFPVFHIDQQFLVLGSQYLTELRDKIDCVTDNIVPGEFSENPHQITNITSQDLYKSGFFYIDGIFYNDMRHPDCRDYSENIMKWAENKQRDIGPFRKALMENTKFIDLDIQFGYPYVYVHQGNCEHFLIFTDITFYSNNHVKNKNLYPLILEPIPKKRTFCMVCHIHTAVWVVCNNKRIPETPFYFCKACFFSFNYDKNGQKIGNFQAYHHVDRSSIL